MESSIAKRDKIGVQDFVLLEDYRSETAFVENLKKRYHENLIYVSMDVLSCCIITLLMYRHTLEAYWCQLTRTRPLKVCTALTRCQNIAE